MIGPIGGEGWTGEPGRLLDRLATDVHQHRAAVYVGFPLVVRVSRVDVRLAHVAELHAGVDEVVCEVADLDVVLLGGTGQQVEGLPW